MPFTLLKALEEDPAVGMWQMVVVGAWFFALLCPWRRIWRSRRTGRAVAWGARQTHRITRRIPLLNRSTPPDPFETLQVQIRLHAVAVEIRELETDCTVYARAARLEARAQAYDALLRNACELAGVVDLDEATGRDGRMQRELELAERGWSW
jgi:hypothetical protein